MRNTEHHSLPALRVVAREQFWTAGAAMRWVAAAAVALFAFLSVVIVLEPLDQGSTPTLMPYLASWPAVLLGVIMPQALWRRENPSERAYLHSMPVGRFTNHLLRNGAGWVWAMIAMVTVFAWGLGAVAILDNARIGSTEPWQWAAPFVCVTVAFLLSSAIATAFDYPAAVIAAVYFVVTGFAAAQVGEGVALGRYGALAMATGSRIVSYESDLMVAVPALDWLIASALWIGLGWAALVAASAIRREG